MVPMSDPHPGRMRRQLYGRRKGPKLSAHQQRLIDTLLPRLALQLMQGADPKTYFVSPPPRGKAGDRGPDPGFPGEGKINDIWLEAGFGAGEHLLAQARAHPDVGLIGAEPYLSGVAKLLSKIDEGTSSPMNGGGAAPAPVAGKAEGASNIRLYTDDARDIIEALPDAALGRVFILFPDPWPKTRHHKRRFVQMELLDRLARVMKPGAELRFASDDADYLAWTLERIMAHPAFEWMARSAADWKTRPADQPPTRYEAKALHGPPVYLSARRL